MDETRIDVIHHESHTLFLGPLIQNSFSNSSQIFTPTILDHPNRSSLVQSTLDLTYKKRPSRVFGIRYRKNSKRYQKIPLINK